VYIPEYKINNNIRHKVNGEVIKNELMIMYYMQYDRWLKTNFALTENGKLTLSDNWNKL
jgi:hypothetical protein